MGMSSHLAEVIPVSPHGQPLSREMMCLNTSPPTSRGSLSAVFACGQRLNF